MGNSCGRAALESGAVGPKAYGANCYPRPRRLRVLQIALVENLQRSDLNPLEEAAGYQRLIKEYYHSHQGLADIIGKSRSHIANTIRLLNLPEKVLVAIKKGP